MTSCFTKMALKAGGHTRTVGPAERPSEAAEHLPHWYRRSDNGAMEECHRVCTGLRHPLCKHLYSCFQRQTLSIPPVCTHLQVPSPFGEPRRHKCMHKITPECLHTHTHTHTQVQHRTPLSLGVQWPRWKESKHANGFTLLERCIWIPPVIFVSLPFAFFLSPLLVASARAPPPPLDSQNRPLTTFECFLASHINAR